MAPGLTFILTVALATTETAPAPTAPTKVAAPAPDEADPDEDPDEADPDEDPDEEAMVAEPPDDGQAEPDEDGAAVPLTPTAPMAPYDADAPEDEVAPMLAEPEPKPKATEDEDKEPTKVRTGIGLMAAGASVTVVGGTLLGVGLGVRSSAVRLITAVQATDNPNEYEATVAQAEVRARNGLVIGVIGGVTAAAGIPLLVTGILRYRKFKLRRGVTHLPHVTPRVAFDGQGAALGVHMRF